MVYRENELVVLTRDVQSSGLIAGDVGTVVGVYGNGGFEVEFVTADGKTIAVETLSGADIRSRRDHEILHVRAATLA